MGLIFNTYTDHTKELYDPDELEGNWNFTGFYPEGCSS